MYGDKAVEPEDILVPDWDKNPLFFGAYSNWPIGSNTARTDRAHNKDQIFIKTQTLNVGFS
jgi:hypothetical protein